MGEIFKHQVLIDTAETIVIGLAIFIVIYLFIMQPNRVDGESMAPNLHTDDYILTEKVSYRFRAPHRGEIIVVNSPTEGKKELIKRVIALPNEKITIKADGIYIENNEHPEGYKLEERYLASEIRTLGDKYLQENATYQLASDEYVVMGDNRSRSSDSRFFGPVKRSAIVGRALLRYWPLGKVSFL